MRNNHRISDISLFKKKSDISLKKYLSMIYYTIQSQFTILPNHAILNSVRLVDCIVKGITVNKRNYTQ